MSLRERDIVIRCIYASNVIFKSWPPELLRLAMLFLHYYHFVTSIPEEYADTVTVACDKADDRPQW